MKYFFPFLSALIISKFSWSQCYSAGQTIPSGYIIASTGNKNLDSIVHSEINNLERFFKFNVDFHYLLEFNGPNAMFHPSCETNGCVGTVFLGLNLLVELYEKHGEDAIHIFRATVAHEFGHAVQKLIYWNEGWKRPELHADYMAGYYIGSNYVYTDEQMMSFYAEFFSLGDNNFFSSGHHGTGEERHCAFLEGYYFAKETNTTVETANIYGLQYVGADNPCGVRKYKAKVEKFERAVKLNMVGNLKVVAADGKKYRIYTSNQVGQAINGFLNQSKIQYNSGGYIVTQPILKTNTFDISPIGVTKSHPVYIYEYSWLFGERLVSVINAEVEKGKTTTIEIHKKRIYTIIE